MEDTTRKKLFGLAALGAGILAVIGFHDVGRQYQQYRIDYAGTFSILGPELAFYAWYFTFGILATLFFTAFYVSFWPGERLEQGFKRFFSWRFFVPTALVLLLAETLAFQRWGLLYSQIADDEATYGFIAQTLLKGRLVNPPPGDNSFFVNQFVILTRDVWYGKYPIGHPAFLALGEALGLRHMVVPALSCVVLFLTWRVGRRLFSGQEASLAVLLLLLSPHFVFMGATRLSYTTESMFMMAGLLALLLLHDEDRLTWSLVAGACLGAGILVRPLPGTLFVPVAAAWGWFGLGHLPGKRRLQHLLAAGIPVALWCGLLLLINSLQTGKVLQSGYQEYHGSEYGLFRVRDAVMSISLAGAILRENFWLFGWPLSLAFIPFARINSRMVLVWGLIGAGLAYRIVAPKTVVATLGPVYLTEIIPLLALVTVSGVVAARNHANKLHPGGRSVLVPGLLVASTLVAGLCFLPFELMNIHRSAESRQRIFRLVDEKTNDKVLVFVNEVVEVRKYETWAYYPPNPAPDMNERAIYVRIRPNPTEDFEFWKRRFPERTAWVFRPERADADSALAQVQTPMDFLNLPVR